MAEQKTVKLAIIGRSPDSFDPSMEGVDVITKVGTHVPAGKEEEIRKAAKDNDVRLQKIG